MLGNTLKDAKYLDRIKDATDKSSDPNHPRHHGIRMQAHHAISADGVKRSGLGKQLTQFGYDINLLPNLVFIPSTLQGACHLGVQPHRGNHTAIIEGEGYDDDDDRPLPYHKMVEKRVAELKRLLTDKCPGDDQDRRTTVCNKMNQISEKIVGLIQKASGGALLTKVAPHFDPGNEIGCGGVDSVTSHRGNNCPTSRIHEDRQGPGQKKEQITFKKNRQYQLKAGR